MYLTNKAPEILLFVSHYLQLSTRLYTHSAIAFRFKDPCPISLCYIARPPKYLHKDTDTIFGEREVDYVASLNAHILQLNINKIPQRYGYVSIQYAWYIWLGLHWSRKTFIH
jgi:hypothetical protein